MQWTTDQDGLIKLGAALFFIVPLLLWFIGIAFIRRITVWNKLFVFIAGSDNRLSLSRLQAFLWTLVIFGSFFAAMAVHKSINPNTQIEANEAKTEADTAARKVESDKTALDLAKTKADNALKEKNKADSDYNDAKKKIDPAKPPEQNKDAQDILDQKQKDLNQKTVDSDKANKDLETAQTAYNDGTKSAQTKKEYADAKAEDARKDNWVDIPAALLALAGIAIGSGVFSSVISAVNSEEKTACVTRIEEITVATLTNNPIYKDVTPTKSDNLLRIIGNDMGNTGKVRLGRGNFTSDYVPILFWRSDGSEIIVDVPLKKFYDTLVVDTPNGKLCMALDDKLADKETKKLINNLKTTFKADSDKANKESQAIAAAKQPRDILLTAATDNLNKLTADKASQSDIDAAQQAFDTAKSDVDTQANLLVDANQRIADAELKIKKLELGNVGNLELGGKDIYYYEFSDLFRDDKNPRNMDLMKFQMFGWTVIAIFIYSWLFLAHLTDHIISLPLVPQAIVILTGLSQTGYLAGKGVTNIKPNSTP